MPAAAQLPRLSSQQLENLGDQIFANECNRRFECLSSWNAGEDFPSLGIGHFIWYRQGQEEAFEETFPELLDFFVRQGLELPQWLAAGLEANSPWRDREEFISELESEKMGQLRRLLLETQAEQTRFIASRLYRSLPQILEAAEPGQRQTIEQRFSELANAEPPYGLYALIDYVHFKGTGTSGSERYQGQGWGLLQVLQNMDEDISLPGFVESAGETLSRRVANAPEHRDEQRWLRGWLNRLQTYLPTSGSLSTP